MLFASRLSLSRVFAAVSAHAKQQQQHQQTTTASKQAGKGAAWRVKGRSGLCESRATRETQACKACSNERERRQRFRRVDAAGEHLRHTEAFAAYINAVTNAADVMHIEASKYNK